MLSDEVRVIPEHAFLSEDILVMASNSLTCQSVGLLQVMQIVPSLRFLKHNLLQKIVIPYQLFVCIKSLRIKNQVMEVKL